MRRRVRKSVSALVHSASQASVLTPRCAVHRLTAALAFLLRLSPVYDSQLAPLLEVLQARDNMKGKLGKGGFGESGVQKPEVRKLMLEVADKLCP